MHYCLLNRGIGFCIGLIWGFFPSWWFVQQLCSSGASSSQEVSWWLQLYIICIKAPGTAQGPHSIAVAALPLPCVCLSRRPELGILNLGRGAALWSDIRLPVALRTASVRPGNEKLITACYSESSQMSCSGATSLFDIVGWNCHLFSMPPQNVVFWAARLKITLCENTLGAFFALLLPRCCFSCHVLDARYVVGVTATSALLCYSCPSRASCWKEPVA